jgi:rhomboid protease GluP
MDSRRMCPHCRAFITTKDKVCPYCNERVGPPAASRRDGDASIGGFIPSGRFNTILILLINFGLYVATTIYTMRLSGGGVAMDIDGRVLYAFGAKVGLADLHGEWWRLVTAGFLHGGLLHILMNSWVLFDLGAQVEEIYGASRMWVIYFISNFAGFLLSAWWSPTVSIGASAALCGLIGAMIALGVTQRHHPMAQQIRAVYIRWAIYLLIFSLLPGVDMMAHVGGGLAGFAIGYVGGLPGREGTPAERLWRASAWFCVLLTIVSFLKLYLWFTQSPS